MKPELKIKRVYEKPLKADGYRVFVDRLWPRGITKEEMVMDEWAKDLAPSPQLRRWFGHDPEFWSEFQKKYRLELRKNKSVDDFIETHLDKKTITLIYAAKDTEHTHALVLQHFLEMLYNEF